MTLLNNISRLIEPKIQIDESRKKFDNASLLRLITPIIVEQFLALLVGIADTLMVSYAGEAAVSGVSLVNQLNNIFIMIFSALASGGAVIASQYIGRKDYKNGVLSASQLVMITTVIAIAAEIIMFMFGVNIFQMIFGKVEQDVFENGMIYLKISALSFPFLAIYNACAGLFRSMGKTQTIMNVSIIMNLINVIGNAIGIFVLHAGVRGVSYPSLVSRVFAAMVMLYLTMNKKNMIYIEIKSVLKWNTRMIRRIFSIAVPNTVESGLFQISKVALSSIVAMFGTVQIAANGVAQSLWAMSALFCLAMGPAFITVVGQYMGAGDIEGADYYMKKLLRITFIGAFVWNMLFLALTPPLLSLYKLSTEAKRLVIILCIMHNSVNFATCPLSFAMSNGLRAAGDVKFTMYSSIFATVICRVAASVLFAVVLDMGIIGITLAMICDWIIKAILVVFRYKSGKWKNFNII